MKNSTLLIKRTILLVIILFSFFDGHSQSTEDTKEFMRLIIKTNQSYGTTNDLIFDLNYADANYIANKTLTEDEKNHIMIFSTIIDVEELMSHGDLGEGLFIRYEHLTDIRDISKVTTFEEVGSYSLLLKLKGEFHSMQHGQLTGKPETWKKFDEMRIPLDESKDAAIRLKKAFIHLGELYGVTIKDGDYF